MRHVVLSALLLTGCDSLFGLVSVRDPASHDADVDDGAITDTQPTDAMTDAKMVDAYVQKSCADLGYVKQGNNSWYRAGGSQKTWIAAELDCEGNLSPMNTVRTHLVVLSDDQEANLVWVNVLGSPATGGFWVGLTDQMQLTNFRWVTDEPVVYPQLDTWSSNEPTNSVSERCVFDSSTLKMFDVNCNESHTFACECDSYPTNGSF